MSKLRVPTKIGGHSSLFISIIITNKIHMLSKEDREEIVGIIQLTVNGKIDKLHLKVDEHRTDLNQLMEKLDPVIDAMGWINTTRRAITWVGGVAGSIAAVIGLIKYLD